MEPRNQQLKSVSLEHAHLKGMKGVVRLSALVDVSNDPAKLFVDLIDHDHQDERAALQILIYILPEGLLR